MQLITKQYNSQLVAFDITNEMMINLTDMAKANGKEISNWLRLDSTKSYLEKLQNSNMQKVQVIIKQGFNGGTWGSRRVAIRFAQWLNDDFAIWVDTQIEELLTTGKVELQPKVPQTYLEALENLVAVEKERARLQDLNNALMHVNKLYTSTELAKELGYRSASKLNIQLKEKRVQYKVNNTWVLYSQFASMDLVSIKQDTSLSGHVYYDRKWTQKGREFVLTLLGIK